MEGPMPDPAETWMAFLPVAAIPVVTFGSAIAVAFAVPAATGVMLHARQRTLPRGRLAARLLLVVVLAVLLGYTLPHWNPSGTYPPTDPSWNLIPGHTIVHELRELQAQTRVMAVQLFGNVGFFIPIGLLLPLGWYWAERLGRTLLAGLAMTVSIELAQLVMTYTLPVSPRWADIDDVILNLLGVLIGWGIWRLAFAPPREEESAT
jgi:glycopeptide antibiotics resistance protein